MAARLRGDLGHIPDIGTNGAIAVGGYIALAGLWAAPITGASMNPVRSLAPDLVRGDFHTTWIYIAGRIRE
jgi:aquaporin Z